MALILSVDEDPGIHEFLSEIFSVEGHRTVPCGSGAEALQRARERRPDVVFMDLLLPGMDGLETLEELRKLDDSLPVIMTTNLPSVRSAVEAMKLGATEYLTKPISKGEALSVGLSAISSREERKLKESGRKRARAWSEPEVLIGESPAMEATFQVLDRVADKEVTVLLVGESGTGKRLFARAVHDRSSRAHGPFVTVDCGTLPETLVESEIFGYRKGAFTGADRNKPGRFELAEGGTLFLDEVGNLPLSAQAKLLRAIDEKVISRLGSHDSIPIDVRIVAATNVDLEKAVLERQFREDLLFRLSVFPIRLPPLRERREDIPLLVEHFLDALGRKHGNSITSISEAALHKLTAHPFRGNVRQLRNMIERAILLADDIILPEHLPDSAQLSEGPPVQASESPKSLKEAERQATRQAEMEAIRNALLATGGNKTRAAKLLGISLKTLYNRLHAYSMFGFGSESSS